ncbi:hypothetical protein ACQEU6_24700 [Spirillospora sp. CA-108201]
MTEGRPAHAPSSGDGRRRAELLADIVAIAVPYRGPLRDVSEFRESAALNRPSILRRVAADLAAQVPREASRLVAAGWGAAVLATALSLHTGLPLNITTRPASAGPEPDGEGEADGNSPPQGDEFLAPGQSVALVVTSTASDTQIQAWVTALAEKGVHVVSVLALLAPFGRGRTVSGGTDAPRTALLTEEELAVSTAGDRP